MGEVKIPEKGIAREKILEEMDDLHEGDANWKDGRTWSLVYYAGDEHTEFLKSAYTKYFSENGLSPLAFPSIKKFETETISMTTAMLGGDDEATGSMTCGGTESILMAVKMHRQWFRAEHPEITRPEMILPESSHPAFQKAAHYFDVIPVRIPVRGDFRADLEATKAAINENTILIVGSAPSYPYGVIDSIPELAAMASERGIGCHVDACLGGFLLPFAKKAGYPIPEFDFKVPGVTSISADIHKYGFSAKGASTVLYRNRELRRHQFFVFSDWCGGIYASPTMTGTRPAGSIAAAWATLKAIGEEGYIKNARQIMETSKKLQEGIGSIPGIKIVGEPEMSVFAFTSDEIDMFAVGDAMDERGWHLDRQPNPNALHIMVALAHEAVADDFISDLEASVEQVRANPSASSEGSAPMYGMVATAPDRGMIKDFVLEAMDGIF
jgi:glutamate/tyrosine decarboxylase-like PLP-dependent enzyme